MNTKTMRLPPRRVLTSDKRKERDGVIEVVSAVTKLPPQPNISRKPATEPTGLANQMVLAGYLSHEFLTNGTLFGEEWNPSQPIKPKPSHVIEPEPEPKRKRYVEVANLLRSDGSHLPGIVNPAQLARFIKL